MSGKYSDKSFWENLTKHAKTVGKEIVENALILYYAAEDPKTPTWARTVIYASLAYFIFPQDAYPDYLPGGYVDDYAVITAAIAVVAAHIEPRHKERAEEKAKDWFGD